METATAQSRIRSAASRIAAALTDHPVLVLAAYFLLQAIIRTLLGAPPNLDEAEQFAISDRFAFGYGPHPPLYQWLQTAAFNVLGVNFLAIALVKNAILFAAYATLFYLGLEVTGNRRLAAIACFGLLFSANFAWESQIDHTHTVTNTFLCVLTALIFFRIAARPSAWLYVALGAAMGFGMLAKYNFLLFMVAIVLAFAMDRQTRRTVLTPWFAMSLLIASAIAGPHYLYIAADPATGAAKIDNLGFNRHGFFATRVEGIATFLMALAGVHGLWLAIVALGYADRRTAPRPQVALIPDENQAACRRMLRLWLILMLIFTGLVIVGGTTYFRDHWLQPESVLFPLVLAILFARFIDDTAFRRLALATAVVMIVIPVAVVAHKRLFSGAQRDAAMPDPAAIVRLAPGIAEGGTPVVVLAEDAITRWFAAGHLRYWLQIPPPAHPEKPGLLPSGPVAIVFASRAQDPAAALGDLAAMGVEGFAEPVELPFFRPGETRRNAPRWYMITR